MGKLGPFDSGVVRPAARTLADAVAQSLREAIVTRRIRPGAPLRQGKLAEEFGVSQAPVREALRALAAEGLVELQTHRKAVVARLTVEELDEMYCIVSALEVAAARRAVPALPAHALETMRRHLQEMQNSTTDAIAWYQANVAFHTTLLTAAGWLQVIRICDHCRRNIGRYVTDRELFDVCVDTWNKRNAALFEACERRNAEAAVAALEKMRDVSIAEIRRILLKEPPSDAAA